MKLPYNCNLNFDKKKLAVGIMLALVSLLLFGISLVSASELSMVNLALQLLVFLGFIFFGALRFETDSPGLSLLINLLWALALAFATLFWSMMAVDYIAIWQLSPVHICLNIAIFLALALLLMLFVPSWKKAMSTAALLLFIMGAVNWLTWQFRGKEILFSDIQATETALNVVAQYVPEISSRAALGFSVWLLMLFAQFSFHCKLLRPKNRLRLGALAGALLLGAAVYVGSLGIPVKTWGKEGSIFNGLYLNFCLSIRDSFVSVPEGYSEEQIKKLEEAYPAAVSTPNDELPNIVVIMNESFADLSVLGENFNTNKAVMPFFDSLSDNTMRGYAYASVYGGGTANSEFEMLTGLSCSQLPFGSIPYTQFIESEVYGLPWLLKSYGYKTLATHPYLSSGWKRTSVYPLLGFDEYSFIEDYPQKDILREYVSDREMYDYVLKALNEDAGDDRLFLFGITMQNHGGYTYEGEDFKQTIELEGYSKDYPLAEQFLSLMNYSDQALEYFISQLEESPEKTLLLIFGDHLPNVEKELFNEIHGGSFNSTEEQMLQYKVPFLIWANYDIQEQTVEHSSLNYLGGYLLDAAGIEADPWYSFLAQMRKQLPAISAMGYYSARQERFLPLDEANEADAQWIEQMSMLQYNSLFDEQMRSKHFFNTLK